MPSSLLVSSVRQAGSEPGSATTGELSTEYSTVPIVTSLPSAMTDVTTWVTRVLVPEVPVPEVPVPPLLLVGAPPVGTAPPVGVGVVVAVVQSPGVVGVVGAEPVGAVPAGLVVAVVVVVVAEVVAEVVGGVVAGAVPGGCPGCPEGTLPDGVLPDGVLPVGTTSVVGVEPLAAGTVVLGLVSQSSTAAAVAATASAEAGAGVAAPDVTPAAVTPTAVGAPLLADGVVPLDDVCPSMRWSTLVTAESTTEPSSDSEVPSVPSSTVAVLKMLAATTGVVAFGRVAR